MRTQTRAEAACVAVLLHFCGSAWIVSASFPPAQNITWKSTNFKTVLTWGPKPTAEYSYTVEFSQLGRDRQKNPHCIQSSQTQCDLSSSLSDLQACYTADVLSEPPQGAPLELKEYPYTSSPRFCPYTDTVLLGPAFRLEVSPDQKQTTVHVSDPLTAVFRDGRQLSIRDVFGDELEYKVTYRRNKSTGKKVVTFKSNALALTDLDPGESYCFQVQALVPSRPTSSQLGRLSQTQCTHQRDPSLLDSESATARHSGQATPTARRSEQRPRPQPDTQDRPRLQPDAQSRGHAHSPTLRAEATPTGTLRMFFFFSFLNTFPK